MPENLIAFRTGCDEVGAQPPAGFPHRFALLTWSEQGGDAADPWALLRLAIPEICKSVGAERVIAEMWRREPKYFRPVKKGKIAEINWADLANRSDEELHENQDFPGKFRFIHKGDDILSAESESWILCGGPAPYHDSVTISFFSSDDLSKSLEAIFEIQRGALAYKLRTQIK